MGRAEICLLLMISAIGATGVTALSRPVVKPASALVRDGPKSASSVTPDDLRRALDEARRAADERSAEHLSLVLDHLGINASIIIALFGTLITVVVVFFALKTKEAAVAEAAVGSAQARELIAAARLSLVDAQAQTQRVTTELETLAEETGRIKAAAEAVERQIADTEAHNVSARRQIDAQLQEVRRERDLLGGLRLDAERDSAEIGRARLSMQEVANAFLRGDQLTVDDRQIVFALVDDAGQAAIGSLAPDQLTAFSVAASERADWHMMEEYARELDRRFGATPRWRCASLFFQAVAYSKRRDYSSAIKAYDTLVNEFEGSDDPVMRMRVLRSRFNLARQHYHREGFETALRHYDDIVRRHGSSDLADERDVALNSILNGGVCLAILKRYDEAIAAYHRIIDDPKLDDPAFATLIDDARFNVACAFARQQDVARAIAALDDWFASAPIKEKKRVDADRVFNAIRTDPAFVAWREG